MLLTILGALVFTSLSFQAYVSGCPSVVGDNSFDVKADHVVHDPGHNSVHERNTVHPSFTMRYYLRPPVTVQVHKCHATALISTILIALDYRNRNPLSYATLPDGFEKSHLYMVRIRLVAGSLLPIIFDTIVLILTIKRTLRHTEDMRRMQQSSITRLLLRDGMSAHVLTAARITSKTLWTRQVSSIICQCTEDINHWEDADARAAYVCLELYS